ncbi:MAG: hypothetical protein WD229_16010, partial [Pirellulales bacterium]
ATLAECPASITHACRKDTDEFHDLPRRSTDELQVDVLELFQKSLDVPAIIFLSFTTGAIASGFFGALGTDLYGWFKNKIKEWGTRIKEEHGIDLQCNMTFTIQHRGGNVSVLVAVRSADLDLIAQRGITAEAIVEQINQVASNRDLQKVAVRVRESEPVMFIEYYTDTAGVVHKPALPEPRSPSIGEGGVMQEIQIFDFDWVYPVLVLDQGNGVFAGINAHSPTGEPLVALAIFTEEVLAERFRETVPAEGQLRAVSTDQELLGIVKSLDRSVDAVVFDTSGRAGRISKFPCRRAAFEQLLMQRIATNG